VWEEQYFKLHYWLKGNFKVSKVQIIFLKTVTLNRNDWIVSISENK